MNTLRPLQRVLVTPRSFVMLGMLVGITASGCSSSSEKPLEPVGQTPAKAKADQAARFEKQALKIDPTGKGKIGPRAFKQP